MSARTKRCQHVSDSPWGPTQCTQPAHGKETKHLYSPSESLEARPSDIVDDVEQAIKDYAAPNEELGWAGNLNMQQNAQEIAFFLADRGLLKE